MGISCEINLNTPKSGYFRTGSLLSGEIKYAVDKNTTFKKITVSFRGVGKSSIEYKYSHNKTENTTDYFYERYVDIDKIILDKSKDQEETVFKTGSYTASFQFNVPNRVPPSVDISRSDTNHTAKYKVVYYVTIKFQRPGLMNFPKRFKKEIQIVSNIIPILPQNPLTLGDRKKLFHLLRRDSIIDVKATILSSAIRAGDKVHLKYQVLNNSNVKIKSVKMKIVETVVFKTNTRPAVTFSRDLDESEAKTGSIHSGCTQQMLVDINVPSDALTVDSCKLASREYYVFLTVMLPLPHTNLCMKIPIEIGPSEADHEDQPPSYWDVMCEDKDRMDDK